MTICEITKFSCKKKAARLRLTVQDGPVILLINLINSNVSMPERPNISSFTFT